MRRFVECWRFPNRSYEVLLTLKNLADLRRSLAPYSLLIIPRALPLEIVGGEHFITTDLLDLIANRALSPGDPEAEASSWEQALRASSVPSTSTSRGSSSALPVPGPEAGSIFRRGFPCQERGLILPLEY